MGTIRHKIHQKAADAYAKYCEAKGAVHRVPSEPLTTIDFKWVTLRDNSAILAKYNLWTGEVVDNSGE